MSHGSSCVATMGFGSESRWDSKNQTLFPAHKPSIKINVQLSLRTENNKQMDTVSDADLMREYADRNSEAAFAEIVRRHINLVYSVALRYVGNSQDAQDVTQAVFIILAKKAVHLRDRAVLTGWLYETTRFASARLRRTNARRNVREQEAYMQSTVNEPDAGEAWKMLAPHLEDAMSRLGEKERTLIALRFFENKSMTETAALLGLEEWAARKRASRAVEKLRAFFTKRGIVVPAAVLTEAISANSVQAAPAMLARGTTAVALAKGTTASVSTLTLVKILTLKGAASFGAAAIGGLLAVIASAYFSLKAHVDDSKSPRERQFVLRMIRKRMVVYLVWLATYLVARELGLFQTPIYFDFFAAAFVFYVFCVDLLILHHEQHYRRREIQIEDHTYVEAEWTMPRKVTDPKANTLGSKVKNVLKGVGFVAFTFVAVGFGGPIYSLMFDKGASSAAPGLGTNILIMILLILLGFKQWQNQPRFQPGGPRPQFLGPRKFIIFPIMFPIMIGLFTLLVFNLTVVFVYAAFTFRTMRILARRRQAGADNNEGGPGCPRV
jgi:RNA polymerase sigma factor (sigma-70 family)